MVLMPTPTCPFQTPIIAGDFACRQGKAVTARIGPQIHCRSEESLEICHRIYEQLKSFGLLALGMKDDLSTTPHKCYLKVQYGGLIGLKQLSSENNDLDKGIEDISQLIQSVTHRGSNIENLPYQDLVPYIQAHELKKRRRHKPGSN